MHPNEETISRFYDAFARLDPATMADCYAPDASFDDEVFSLRGRQEVAAMWTMLCENASKTRGDWQLTYSGLQADASEGRARWDAHYRFSATGRLVHNIIHARFSFTPQGLIATHRDRFDFWRWSRQALGAPGLLLGWTPMLHAKVRKQAAANLERYKARKA